MKTPRLSLPASFLLACLAAGCPHRPGSTTESLDRAAKEAQSQSATARTVALAGFRAFLVDSDFTQAQRRFDEALHKDGAEPYALFGQLLLARRAGHPERAVAAALDLCERAPRHPLAAAGARYILDLSGAAIPLDDQMVQRLPAALAAGLVGDAAHLFRSAVANIQGQRGDLAAQATTLASMGVPDRMTLLGPFTPYHVLSLDDPLPPEKDGSLAGPFKGPYGSLTPRALGLYEGRISLAGEPSEGDMYVLAVDMEASESTAYAVRAVGVGSYKLYVDGTLLLERRAFERTNPSVAIQGIELGKGRHRLLIKMVRDDRATTLTFSVIRPDGKPSSLRFTPATGRAHGWGGVGKRDAEFTYPTAEAMAEALRPEAGDALAELLAIRDAMVRDREGAKRLMAHLSTLLSGPALTGMRAELAQGDRTIPQKVARGRATRDLEATLDKDHADVNALLTRANTAIDEGRTLEAAEFIKQARAAPGPVGYPVALMDSRVQLALGVDAQAEQSALEAVKLQPGLCEALNLRYDLARRRDAIALSDQLVKELAACPGNITRTAEHARTRGDLATAVSLYERLLEKDPGQIAAAVTVSNLYLSLRRYEEARKALQRMRELWPLNASVVKRLADVAELVGDSAGALKLRDEALLLDGSDLQLRRIVERARTGKELLADHAIDGKKAIADYEARRGSEESATAYVLDAAAIRAYPDGSMVDRIHIIQKAVDQSGISDMAEVSIPGGAQVLVVRTIKPDGTALEPENIEGKESISLPGVQVGDFVEYEYLLPHSPRGPDQPGWTATNFYFQIARTPNNWSTYTVIAPKGTGMGVDAHNLQAPPPKVVGDEEIFFHEERRVPPYIPEPNGPPSATEYLPFVSVGAGSTGNDQVVAAYSDAFLDRGQLTFEVEQFAREAAAGKTGLAAVKAIYAAVMTKLSGRDSGLTISASSSLAQDRGSRLWAIKASLEVLGIPARLAAIRTFAADPAPFRYPAEQLLPYVCLRVEPPGSEPVWLDASVRFGPFGELPEQATGGREAWLLPEPGRPLARLQSPPAKAPPAKEVRLQLKLAPDGKLSGSGEELYSGIEAAQLAEALDAISPDQRTQALQGALARYFNGAELSNLKIDSKQEVGAPLAVRYQFTAPRFARVEGDRMTFGAITFPASLGKRFVQLGSRRTPLYVDETEGNHTVVELELPPGYATVSPVAEIKSGGKHGSFLRREAEKDGKLRIEEWYRLSMARIPVKEYDEFATFAGEVDLIQARDIVVQRRGAQKPQQRVSR